MRSSWVARPTKASPPFWPTQEGAYAELVNPIPKYVASRTIKEPLTWNSHLLGPDLAEDVAALKSQGVLPQSWMYSPSIPLCALGRHVQIDPAVLSAAQDLGVHGAGK